MLKIDQFVDAAGTRCGVPNRHLHRVFLASSNESEWAYFDKQWVLRTNTDIDADLVMPSHVIRCEYRYFPERETSHSSQENRQQVTVTVYDSDFMKLVVKTVACVRLSSSSLG